MAWFPILGIVFTCEADCHCLYCRRRVPCTPKAAKSRPVAARAFRGRSASERGASCQKSENLLRSPRDDPQAAGGRSPSSAPFGALSPSAKGRRKFLSRQTRVQPLEIA